MTADPLNVCLLGGFMVEVQLHPVESVTSRRFGGRYGSRTRDFQISVLVLYP